MIPICEQAIRERQAVETDYQHVSEQKPPVRQCADPASAGWRSDCGRSERAPTLSSSKASANSRAFTNASVLAYFA
jgi:hypothetical protein